nr:hypothetical protein [Chloroflexota bacterium]
IVRRACASAREESSEDAADAGAAWAWAVVRDSAAVTLLACALLWWVGTAYAVDVLADFAAVLFIGVAVSTAMALVIGPALSLLAVGRRERRETPAPADAPPDRQESVPTAAVPAGG